MQQAIRIGDSYLPYSDAYAKIVDTCNRIEQVATDTQTDITAVVSCNGSSVVIQPLHNSINGRDLAEQTMDILSLMKVISDAYHVNAHGLCDFAKEMLDKLDDKDIT